MYGFVNGVSGVCSGARVASRCSQFSGVGVRAVRPQRVVVPRRTAAVRMEFEVPNKAVLGLGKDIPGITYLALSLLCLFMGSYCVYESNIVNALTPESIKPLYVVGSLLLPISWGCHVAAWIKLKQKPE